MITMIQEEMDCRQGLSAPDKQLTSGGLGGMSCQGAQIDSSCSVCARSSAADHARSSGKAPLRDSFRPLSTMETLLLLRIAAFASLASLGEFGNLEDLSVQLSFQQRDHNSRDTHP